MKQILKPFLLLLTLSSILFSCTKEETTIEFPVTAITVSNLPADTVLGINAVTGMPFSAGKYTFYSLERNAIVPNADSASTKWDLAFAGTKILINGGTSGTGLGGAFIYTGLFDNVKTISNDSVFKTDNAPASFAVTYGSGKGWYVYDQLTSLVTPLAGRVLVIRTASGKYAKLEIINYYKGGVTLPITASDNDKLSKQRYYTFRYTYQPNGSKTF
jgi:hypothetical protein